jgi:uncharacterized protein YoxC
LKDVGKILVWLPVLILAIGLIGWVLTLRNDVTGTVQQVDGFHEELAGVNQRIDDDMTVVDERHNNLLEAVVTVERELNDRIADLEKSLAVANDQMQTIMGDHMGFADVLRELGESGALPSGERRAYGGYGN